MRLSVPKDSRMLPYPQSSPENPHSITSPQSSRGILSRNGHTGSVVLAASSSARASLFARYWTPARAPAYPAPRSLLVARKNPPRAPFLSAQLNRSV